MREGCAHSAWQATGCVATSAQIGEMLTMILYPAAQTCGRVRPLRPAYPGFGGVNWRLKGAEGKGSQIRYSTASCLAV